MSYSRVQDGRGGHANAKEALLEFLYYNRLALLYYLLAAWS